MIRGTTVATQTAHTRTHTSAKRVRNHGRKYHKRTAIQLDTMTKIGSTEATY